MLYALKTRLKTRQDSEHEQAVLRIVIVTIVLCWMAVSYEPSDWDSSARSSLLLTGLAIDLVFATGLFAAICIWPAANVYRRVIGSLADNVTATFVMFMTDEAGFSMLGVYLFVAFGNGFRYGRRYLFISQGLALAGFASVLMLHPYWLTLQTAGWSLFVALVVLPVYVSTLLKRIHEAQRRAEEANVAKTSFLANMSHEMRTPLNGIVGVADLIRATTLTPKQAELIRLLSHSTAVLRSLVDDVLDISKIEAGRVSIELSDFDLHATLNGVIHLLRPHAEAKGLTLRAVVDPAIDYTLRGDQHHLRQILLNLISNAVKFTQKGWISVEVMLRGETEDSMRVRFEVRDTGIGIAPEVQSRIFDAFVQADDSTTRRFGGTGLGTTIAKQLVELMEGRIGLESKVGEGSLFWFEIRLQKTLQQPEQQADPRSIAGLVVAERGLAPRMTDVVERAVGSAKEVTGSDAANQLVELRKQGVSVPAVIVSGPIEQAVQVLNDVCAARADVGTALIYVTDDPVGARSDSRLGTIPGLQVLGTDSTHRHLRNAIHAATTRDLGDSATGEDLGAVLQQQRKPARVLVAEDNATNLAILRQLLESAGHTVYSATNGEEALDVYESESPDVAILDFNMPERNGVEVVAAIRAMEPTGVRMPVIILSAAVTVEAKERARLGGADEFVGKPFNAAQFLHVVDRLSRGTSQAGSNREQPAQRHVLPPSDDAPLVDKGRLEDVERISSTPDFIFELIRGFKGDVESLLRKLDAATASGQTGVVRDTLHAIKGAAVSIGATRLAAQCAEMEGFAQRGLHSQIFANNPAMRACYESTVRALDKFAVRKNLDIAQ